MSKIPANMMMDGAAFFGGGMDSGTLPRNLPASQYVAAMNVVHRGGVPQTRPGFTTIFGMPCGQPQGIILFQPTDSPMYLVIAVDGFIYISQWENAFKTYELLTPIRFSNLYQNVYFCVCQQFTDYDATGNLYTLQTPKAILMMQDGVSRAAYWDGKNAAHLNPTPSDKNSALSPPGFDGTPQGTWMAWEGARLWVAFGSKLYASDFGNPLKFKESEYLANVPSFQVPGNVTGMIQPTPQAPLLVFTDGSITLIQCDVRDRTLWSTTPNFQQDNYSVNCVAGRSVIRSFGIAWWYASQGLTNMNYASQQTLSSQYTYLDQQMSISKRFLSSNLTGICAVAFENYILISVPSSNRWNAHTWCLDQTPLPFQQVNGSQSLWSPPSWSSYWTGIRPVEWTADNINGTQYCFCLSRDYDDVNRVWQAFDGSRTDNGCPITAWLQTKAHDYSNLNLKRFQYADMHLMELLGDVDIGVSFASERGAWQPVMNKRISATSGMSGFVDKFAQGPYIQSYRAQTRYLKTQNNDDQISDCNFCGVESDERNYVSNQFSLLFEWSGRAGLMDYRLMANGNIDDEWVGRCEPDETGIRVLTERGCSSFTTEAADSDLPEYIDAATVVLDCPEGQTGNPSIGMAVRKSTISQLDAEKRAECAAFQDALRFLTCTDD